MSMACGDKQLHALPPWETVPDMDNISPSMCVAAAHIADAALDSMLFGSCGYHRVLCLLCLPVWRHSKVTHSMRG
jgi:hypothetical protein